MFIKRGGGTNNHPYPQPDKTMLRTHANHRHRLLYLAPLFEKGRNNSRFHLKPPPFFPNLGQLVKGIGFSNKFPLK